MSVIEFASPVRGFVPSEKIVKVKMRGGAAVKGELLRFDLDGTATEADSDVSAVTYDRGTVSSIFSNVTKVDADTERAGHVYCIATEAIADEGEGDVCLWGIVDALSPAGGGWGERVPLAAHADGRLAPQVAPSGGSAGSADEIQSGTVPVLARSFEATESGELGKVWFTGGASLQGSLVVS